MESLVTIKVVLFVAPLYVSAVTLAAMHWYPQATKLDRKQAYTLGTFVTVGVPAAVMLLAYLLGVSCGELYWASLLLANAAISGGSVHAYYWIDEKRPTPITLDEVANAIRTNKQGTNG